MAEWQDVFAVNALSPGEHAVFRAGRKAVIIVNVAGEFFAVDDLCTHDGGTLSEGCLEGDQLICPRHGARFCVKTGDALTPPAYEPISTYPLRIVADRLQIQL